MAKQALKLKELFELQEELKVILGEKLTILTRYQFSDLKKTVDAAVSTATETKDELIKQFGETDDSGQVNLKIFIDEDKKTVNPKFDEFVKEWNAVLDTEKEILYTPIKLTTIENIQTEKNIEVLFKLLEGAMNPKHEEVELQPVKGSKKKGK